MKITWIYKVSDTSLHCHNHKLLSMECDVTLRELIIELLPNARNIDTGIFNYDAYSINNLIYIRSL